MNNPSKPIRVSKEVKDALKEIKQKKELRSVDAVIKRLLTSREGLKYGKVKKSSKNKFEWDERYGDTIVGS
jgi:hypothetical protein